MSTITIHLHGWLLPLLVTVAGIIMTALVCKFESRGGDYSLPVASMGTALASVTATIVAWAIYFGLKLFTP